MQPVEAVHTDSDDIECSRDNLMMMMVVIINHVKNWITLIELHTELNEIILALFQMYLEIQIHHRIVIQAVLFISMIFSFSYSSQRNNWNIVCENIKMSYIKWLVAQSESFLMEFRYVIGRKRDRNAMNWWSLAFKSINRFKK